MLPLLCRLFGLAAVVVVTSLIADETISEVGSAVAVGVELDTALLLLVPFAVQFSVGP